MPGGGLNALRHSREPACWRCGQPGHMARNCPLSLPGAEHTQTPTGTALAQLQQDEEMLALFHRQERVQEKMIEAQARLAQQDAKGAMAGMSSDAPSLAQMAVHASPSMPRAPLIAALTQPAGYIYVGHNEGAPVWGHADIVAASIPLEDIEQAKNT